MHVPIELKQIMAFTKRDFISWTTYRTAVVTQLINVFIGIISWGIGATYVQKPVTEMYNSDYISFLVVGIAISNLVLPLAQGIERQLNPWTLETVLMTGIKTPVFVIGNIMWTYIFSVFTFIPYILIGIYFFGAKLNINIPCVIFAFIISAAILVGLSMISTGFRVVTKASDPITWSLNVLQNLLSGVSFPVLYLNTIFFPGFSTLSWFIPQTWVYHLWRLAMLTNPSILDLNTALEFVKGAAFASILLPLGYRVLRWGIVRSKREGTLGWY
jgi:ABC-2 type transport system permease protein